MVKKILGGALIGILTLIVTFAWMVHQLGGWEQEEIARESYLGCGYDLVTHTSDGGATTSRLYHYTLVPTGRAFDSREPFYYESASETLPTVSFVDCTRIEVRQGRGRYAALAQPQTKYRGTRVKVVRID